KDDEIYYNDGNVDLVIQGIDFRVYRGVLAQFSPIFKDMFDLGSPSPIDDTSGDGSFVIQGPGTTVSTVTLKDSVRDWRHVLRALYQGRYLLTIDVLAASSCPSFDILSAYIRLGHKYQISIIYDPAMAYLKWHFAPTFSRWKTRSTSGSRPYTLPHWEPENTIGVVNLARLTDEDSILPLALLGCCQLGDRLSVGFRYSDGIRETLSARDTLLCLESVAGVAAYGVGHTLAVRSAVKNAPTEPTKGSRWPRVRDKTLWLDDGNLILVVENIEFRIYKGILAHHSPVFSDMLSLPPPASSPNNSLSSKGAAVDTEEGIPVVTLPSDAARDWRHVLEALMGRQTRSADTMVHRVATIQGSKTSSEELFAFIRIGHKYQIDGLYKPSMAFLKTRFPPKKPVSNRHRLWSHETHPLGFDAAHAVGVVNLARLTGETSLLPAAFLLCCQNSLTEEGFLYSDGHREVLGADDLIRCLKARATLMGLTASVLSEVVLLSVDHPKYREKCLQEVLQFGGRRVQFNMRSGPRLAADPFLKGFEGWEDWNQAKKSLCWICQYNILEKLKEKREEIWKRLPKILNIEIPEARNGECSFDVRGSFG
ncbi:uncharacterized protein BXZ73DRAFT_49803, partial [Epithele typhae]|uniref:uncharacterized protein n=1 Tax=Epithele typhae TaxID=378194 RepID=UPI0020079DC7